MGRAIVIVLDSFGLGSTPDAYRFGDAGANTLGAIATAAAEAHAAGERPRVLTLPNLERLGLGEAALSASGRYPAGFSGNAEIVGAWGAAREQSSGKDTPSGHWELAGLPVLFDWGYFQDRDDSFPPELLNALVEQAGLPGLLGNCHASGTEILKRLGEAHIKSGKPIVYTSADSVFQIAAHEEHFGLERLYEVSAIARQLVDGYQIGRVIARPFVGASAEDFVRTGNRRDLTTPPHGPTLLTRLVESGGEVISVGKISDIFAAQGITQAVKASGNDALMAATEEVLATAPDRSLVFTNLVDFDMVYGHRRNALGYADALERFDSQLPSVLRLMQEDDVLVLCADHGCDPSWPGTDHTREHIPVLAYGKRVPPGSLGIRSSFADVGQSLATWLELAPLDHGHSFLRAA